MNQAQAPDFMAVAERAVRTSQGEVAAEDADFSRFAIRTADRPITQRHWESLIVAHASRFPRPSDFTTALFLLANA